MFRGVGVALVTIFDDDGEIDPGATSKLAGDLVARGMQAVLVCGSTGEAATLTGAVDTGGDQGTTFSAPATPVSNLSINAGDILNGIPVGEGYVSNVLFEADPMSDYTAAGIKTVWLSHGTDKPFEGEPWLTVRDLLEFTAVLKRCV